MGPVYLGSAHYLACLARIANTLKTCLGPGGGGGGGARYSFLARAPKNFCSSIPVSIGVGQVREILQYNTPNKNIFHVFACFNRMDPRR